MKKLLILLPVCLIAVCSCTKTVPASVPAQIKEGKIVLETPAREAGQQSAVNMACDPIETIRVAFVGIGGRGSHAVWRWTCLDGVEIKALCDLKQEKIDKVNNMLAEQGRPAADGYVGEEAYKELCRRDDIDLVYIATDWLDHTPIALCALNNGKHAAIEVPAAMTVKECWDLINATEKNRRHCMMLENGCYDFFEMSTLNMAQHGLFGEIYHVEGAYIHYLSEGWNESETWRLDYNMDHRGDNYPTHGLGPICQVLNIHRGSKMDYLVAMDTPSYNGREAAMRYRNEDRCANGDHTISLIRTNEGKVIEVQHNVYAPRPYSRMHQLTGTRGFVNKYPIEQICVKDMNGHDELSSDVRDSLLNAYKPDFLNEIEEKAKSVGGHGGMDFLMDYRLAYCLHNGLPPDEDVYDCAEWSAVQELSRISLENGSMPVEFPDFTRGEWNVIKGFSYATK